MVDNAPQYALGEDIDGDGSNGGSIKKPILLTGTVVKGDPIIIAGGSVTDDIESGAKNTVGVASLTRGIAMEDGIAGETITMLQQGRTKVKFGGAVALNANLGIEITSADFVTNVAAAVILGFAMQAILADGDFGIIYFDGISGAIS